MSARLSTVRPRACSGDMYAAVPRMIPACVMAGDGQRRVRAAAPLRRGIHGLRQPEIEHLHRAVACHLDVGRLQVTVHDAGLVRGLERIGNLARDRQRLAVGMAPRSMRCESVFPLHQLHDERHVPSGVVRRIFEAVDLRDVRVIQGRKRPRLTIEAGEPLGIEGERAGQDLQRDVAAQPRIARSVHFPHAARPERGNDLVGPETRTGRQSHCFVSRRIVTRQTATQLRCRVGEARAARELVLERRGRFPLADWRTQ